MVEAAVRRLWVGVGAQIRDARLARHWSVQTLAVKAGVSRVAAYRVEAGRPALPETVVRLATALGLRLDFALTDPRRRSGPAGSLSVDIVHGAMGEFEARHLRRLRYGIGMDEPYQHFQFAGRADVAAWDLSRAALLHIENRTRFPDFQAMAGSYNAKRAYFAQSIAERVGIGRWSSETHVMAALWSAEVLHALRLRRQSFISLCPDPVDSFRAWWMGEPPTTGTASVLIVVDPLATGRQRQFISLDEAMMTRPRHRGYAEAAERLSGSR